MKTQKFHKGDICKYNRFGYENKELIIIGSYDELCPYETCYPSYSLNLKNGEWKDYSNIDNRISFDNELEENKTYEYGAIVINYHFKSKHISYWYSEKFLTKIGNILSEDVDKIIKDIK